MAIDFTRRDTIPSDKDSTKKDSSMAFNINRQSDFAVVQVSGQNSVPGETFNPRNTLIPLKREAEKISPVSC
jgi:hypothetical protein